MKFTYSRSLSKMKVVINIQKQRGPGNIWFIVSLSLVSRPGSNTHNCSVDIHEINYFYQAIKWVVIVSTPWFVPFFCFQLSVCYRDLHQIGNARQHKTNSSWHKFLKYLLMKSVLAYNRARARARARNWRFALWSSVVCFHKTKSELWLLALETFLEI